VSGGKIHTKYWLETYGCQMNSAESNALETALKAAGLQPAASAEEADCAILNTCSVRKTAENRIWGRIGYFQHLKEKGPITLVVTGCMAERLGQEFLDDAPAVDHVMGTNDKLRIAALLSGGSDEREIEYSFTNSYYKPGEFKSYVPIMNGCDNFCSYCIVPYVRGREVSRSPESVFEEVDRLEQLGVKEITLLGQNVNSYHYVKDGKVIKFYDLLADIANRSSSIRWIRFESPHPKDFSDNLIDVIASEPKVARHLHIPAQSGSTEVLKLMNRKYSRQRYLELVYALKNKVSDLTLTTDVMVGFPGETEQDFQQTLDMMKEVQFLEAFMYYFNPREGTKAVTMAGQLPSEVRMSRLQQLIDLQRSITVAQKTKRAKGKTEILVESISKKDKEKLLGRNEHDEMVVFKPKSKIELGTFIEVELEKLVGNTYHAHQII
jgi:tRNA-2-methylthio-N6-dimethylallyladenosine synthase